MGIATMSEKKYLPGDLRQRVTDLYKAKGISQAQLAKAVDIDKSIISRFLSGKTDRLSDEHIIRLARYFGVSTDFLLGETDQPERINYDIEELGLTVQAAKNLYTRKIDPDVLCQILEHDKCGELMQRIKLYQDETISSCVAAQNQLMDSIGSMLIDHVQAAPADKNTAQSVLQTMQAMKRPVYSAERTAIGDSFTQIVQDMKKAGPNHVVPAMKMTKNTMQGMRTNLKKGQNQFNLRKVTPESLVNSILGQLDMTDAPEDLKPEMEKVKDRLHADLIDYFTILQKAGKQLG